MTALVLGLFLARRTGVAFVMITMALATLVAVADVMAGVLEAGTYRQETFLRRLIETIARWAVSDSSRGATPVLSERSASPKPSWAA